MTNIKIKAKLIILFIIIKIIPLLIIAYIAVKGAKELDNYFTNSTKSLLQNTQNVITTTASKAIDDSIKMLDKKSQNNLERISYELANQIANFLYERDSDILFLSKLSLNQQVIQQFYDTKFSYLTTHEEFIYDDKSSRWISSETKQIKIKEDTQADLIDNKKEFHYTNPKTFQTLKTPLYKEVVFFDLKGNEKYKVSQINKNKRNISKQQNTYIKAETYFKQIQTLKKGEIYVSDVIGAYVNSKLIGTFSKQKAKKMGIDFKPHEHGYAGVENPKGKKFDGIIRFITPTFKNGVKTGYISLALDHRHIMEFTDTTKPTGDDAKQNISNASDGNYAFMWDYEGKNISHPRDYFIVGYDPNTGKRIPGWVSKDIADKFKESKKKDLLTFLSEYPKFEEQSLNKKPNLAQLKNLGQVALDCRYLNFAPQCQGWMQVTKDGGYGSFVIYWSKVWKLTTAAAIPYYTGKYANSKRGFGFVTIGANVGEFHLAANKTKQNVDEILNTQTKVMEDSVLKNLNQINIYLNKIIQELSIVTVLMVLVVIAIAIVMSNYITSKIKNLLVGTQKFANNELDYKIEVSSDDEIGNLENSFNDMAAKIDSLIKEQKSLNEDLEEKVKEKTAELLEINENLEEKIRVSIAKSRQKDTQLIQQSKRASMGEMLSMIIHQWKQPLNAIGMVNSSMDVRVQMGINTDDDIKKDNIEIKKQIDLMSQTMNDFRDFFKQTQKETYIVKQTIQKSLQLIDHIYKSNGITLNLLKTCDAKTKGYSNELMQVVINIFNNSRDVIIEKNIKHPQIDISLDEDEKYLYISIQDFAGGIPQEILPKIFDPYFTTKDEDKGTGLGLYMSKMIIEKVQGTIEVQNRQITKHDEQLSGANFTIKLLKE
jgi:signal transduction histidine kinase